ncbi:cupin domain-containing protein [Microbacterium esteraromaticum]|uniref:Cupin domain-containing protein n=1 Tax=Microbacterium esteraromaticum TaxID=57043 RepID=A0A939DWC4_9MICO|nr:cupin domain-containing protein [Microbacterium esteraromaticum]
MLTADGIGEMLGMAPVPIEGGLYAQTWRDEQSTGIYYLMTPDDCSGLHALPGVELWSYHAGAPREDAVVIRPEFRSYRAAWETGVPKGLSRPA